ncbi:uncharacterized protein LOC129728916 [Wyeomyia smithii]|uniref:uncharacterized protein LOC129728916 n=1 Tax=Wyeomyia smithii TaxID=174621 RepID=UPI002467F32B|nr:uncharacterized protein LOC129728916 [Wyeomyia smithii]
MPLSKKSTLRKHTVHLKSLVRKRDNILGSAKLIQCFHDSYEDSKVDQVAIRIERLDGMWDKFEDIEDEIEALEDQEDGFSETRQEFQNLYFELKASLVSKLPRPAVANPSTSESRPVSQIVPPANHAVHVKLPEIKIPEFGGKSDEWIEFRDLYKSLVHSNAQIPSVQKLHYLRSALKGEASRLILSFTIISDNYATAWKTICDRYENKNFLVKQHMSAILKIPHVKRESASALAKLADEFNRHVGILDKLELFEAHWNSFLVERLSSLLDEKSLMDWEAHCNDNTVPQYDELMSFIIKRSRTLRMCKSNYTQPAVNQLKAIKYKSSAHVVSESVVKCPNCKQAHPIFQCELFLKLSPNNRLDFVKKHQLCINCLRGGHMARDCRGRLCKTCAKRHHSLLHLPPITSVPSLVEERQSILPTYTAVCSESMPLPEASFSVSVVPSVVSSRSSQQATRSPPVSSVESSPSPTSSVYLNRQFAEIEPLPSCSNDNATVFAPTNKQQKIVFLSTALVRIVDVDGIGHYARALLDSASQSHFISESLCQKLGLKRTRINIPKTMLGYVVCGNYSANESATVACHIVTDQNLNIQLEKMWEVENLDIGKALTQEEQEVENHFQQTVSRDTDGRYVLRLPLRESLIPLLASSYEQAKRRFLLMEKRFSRDNTLRDEYVKFMDDYESMGHMEVGSSVAGPQYFLPHHAVHRLESSTTKTRVVFDASSKGSGTLTLNDVLRIGPTVQPTLLATVVNFRMPQYVFTADAEKMFRQIWIHPEDRSYQQIVWRRDSSMPLQIYQLKTVTYGLASSPYQAARVLNKLSEDEGHKFPLASKVVTNRFYVDDCLAGSDNLEEATEICRQLRELLGVGGFTLRKWSTNCQTVLQHIPSELWDSDSLMEIGRSTVTALGLLWNPRNDSFSFKIPTLPGLSTVTKRIVVSETSQLFDPLGLLGAVVVNARMFVQRLWAKHVSWDEEVSSEESAWWKDFRSELTLLQQ